MLPCSQRHESKPETHNRMPADVHAQVICLQLPLAFGSVGLWASLRGLPVDQVTPDELDAVLLASDLVQLAGVLAIVRSSLQADAPRFGARPQVTC